MGSILVDSNILLDLFTGDPRWGGWSRERLEILGENRTLLINSIVYAEIALAFRKIEELETELAVLEIRVAEIPREALFLAGKAFLRYRKAAGKKCSPLPDFFIGAHASVLGVPLLTRDLRRYSTYFPGLKIIGPEKRA